MTVYLKTYYVAPHYKNIDLNESFNPPVTVMAKSSEAAAKIAIDRFWSLPCNTIKVWRSESRRCFHVYDKLSGNEIKLNIYQDN